MSDFTATFEALKAILKPYEPSLEVIGDGPTGYSLNAGFSEKYQKVIWFGGVEIKKNYVSYHLMPIYLDPALQDSISPALKKRMQGKSCFNFRAVDPALFEELKALTERGVDRFRQQQLIT